MTWLSRAYVAVAIALTASAVVWAQATDARTADILRRAMPRLAALAAGANCVMCHGR
jgi:hypothetical protein